jgi:hypothetical protein
MNITPKVDSILRQRYAECKAASKVFRRPLPKIALYGYGISTTSNVMYSVRGFLGCQRIPGCDCLDWLNSPATEAIKGLRWLFELLSVKAHFVEGC